MKHIEVDYCKLYEIRIVLVRSLYDRNIGASSRAMSNMGADQLILIGPQCEITYDAQQAAASGQDGLQNRIVYSSWEEFNKNEPESIRLAFTARDGQGRSVKDIGDVLNDIQSTHPACHKDSRDPLILHLIFGPEDWGLSADDLQQAHFACAIPTFGPNWSLNLAQAVLLALYQTRLSWKGRRTQLTGQRKVKPSSVRGEKSPILKEENEMNTGEFFPDQAFKLFLEELGFSIENRRIDVFQVFRKMLLRSMPDKQELHVIDVIFRQAARKIKEYNLAIRDPQRKG